MSTDLLLPAQQDYRRWIAEEATLAIKRVVREAIARAAQAGAGMHVSEAGGHRIGALVTSRNGETYLAVMAEGFVDTKILSIILASVPDVDPGDWLPEPGSVLGIKPGPGQLVFSTMLPGPALSFILEEVNGHFLSRQPDYSAALEPRGPYRVTSAMAYLRAMVAPGHSTPVPVK